MQPEQTKIKSVHKLQIFTVQRKRKDAQILYTETVYIYIYIYI